MITSIRTTAGESYSISTSYAVRSPFVYVDLKFTCLPCSIYILCSFLECVFIPFPPPVLKILIMSSTAAINSFRNYHGISYSSLQSVPLIFNIVLSLHASILCFKNFQIFSRYVKSRSDQQLLHGLKYNDTSSCKPEQLNNGLPIVPCGLIAWSLFNDTFNFVRRSEEMKINRKNIAWKSDRDHKFGKEVYPFNFQNGTLIGGGKLDPRIPVSLFRLQQFISSSFPSL